MYLSGMIFQSWITGSRFFEPRRLSQHPDILLNETSGRLRSDTRDSFFYCGSKIDRENKTLLAEGMMDPNLGFKRKVSQWVLSGVFLFLAYRIEGVSFIGVQIFLFLGAIAFIFAASLGHFLVPLAITLVCVFFRAITITDPRRLEEILFLTLLVTTLMHFDWVEAELTPFESEEANAFTTRRKRLLKDTFRTVCHILALAVIINLLVPNSKPVERASKIRPVASQSTRAKVPPPTTLGSNPWLVLEPLLGDLGMTSLSNLKGQGSKDYLSKTSDQSSSQQPIGLERLDEIYRTFHGLPLEMQSKLKENIQELDKRVSANTPNREEILESISRIQKNIGEIKAVTHGEEVEQLSKIQSLLEGDPNAFVKPDTLRGDLMKMNSAMDTKEIVHGDSRTVESEPISTVFEKARGSGDLPEPGVESPMRSLGSAHESAIAVSPNTQNQTVLSSAQAMLEKISSPAQTQQKKPFLTEESIRTLQKTGKNLAYIAAFFLMALFLRQYFRESDPPSCDDLKRKRLDRRFIRTLREEIRSLATQELSLEQEVVRKYYLFLDLMSQLNLPRPAHLPPTEYCRMVSTFFPWLSYPIFDVTDLFSDCYYGKLSVEERRMGVFRESFSHICRNFL